MAARTLTNRKEISFEFESKIRGNRDRLKAMGLDKKRIDNLLNNFCKVSVSDPHLNRLADEIGFPKERMFL